MSRKTRPLGKHVRRTQPPAGRSSSSPAMPFVPANALIFNPSCPNAAGGLGYVATMTPYRDPLVRLSYMAEAAALLLASGGRLARVLKSRSALVPASRASGTSGLWVPDGAIPPESSTDVDSGIDKVL